MEATAQPDTPKQSLASRAFSLAMDGLAEICDNAFAHATQRMEDFHPITASDAEARRFFLLCTRGYRIAQKQLIARLLTVEHIRADLSEMRGDASKSHDKAKRLAIDQALRATEYSEKTLRMIANGIAWTLLGGKPWVLRRYYFEHPPVPLSSSNLSAAMRFVSEYQRCPNRLAFITDLTSCIQMGDLILVDHTKRLRQCCIAELKEGAKSKEMLGKIKTMFKSGSTDEFGEYLTSLSLNDLQHIGRTTRQLDRMLKTMEILNTDRGIDPVSGKEFHLIDSDVRLCTYDRDLSSILDIVTERGHEIRLIEGCIWIGAFDSARVPEARRQFESYVVNNCGLGASSNQSNPWKWRNHRLPFGYTDLSQAVTLPQIRPLFLRALRRECLLKILRREWTVYLYLDLDQLFVEFQRFGLTARWQTKAERREHQPDGAFAHYGNSPVVQIGSGAKAFMGDIAMVRLLYEGWTVESLAEWYKQFLNHRGIVRS
jgi:hypothetical protein